jgi:GGDEF domain-containing protein
VGSQPLQVTVSIGISVFPLAGAAAEATSEKTGQRMIELADAALLRAKRDGRNRVEA